MARVLINNTFIEARIKCQLIVSAYPSWDEERAIKNTDVCIIDVKDRPIIIEFR